MPFTTSMKQLGSKNIGCTVELMEWSNKMDLVAIGNEKGEVIVQRLNWQKIVTFPTPADNVHVTSLSWQSDEPIVAAGYSNGKVALIDTEQEDVVFSLSYKDGVSKVYFSKAIEVKDYKNTYRRTEPTDEAFLPPLPPLTSAGSTIKSIHDRKSFAKGSPCFLIVLLNSGMVHLLLLGALKTGTIDTSQHVENPDNFMVHDVFFNNEFNCLFILVRDGSLLKVLHFNNKVLQGYLSPMLHLAQRCANILEIKSYIDDTVQCLTEAWETVLMEMDNKLTKYASTQPDGSISADFLELLVCGYATLEIEEFLMDELTEKGVKKLATSVDLSCSTMQSLVMRPLIYAASSLFYFLNTIKGLSRIDYFFKPLIDQDCAESVLRMCGGFLLKVQELQKVLCLSVYDIKLFFNWLSVVIIRLRQQDVPEDLTQLTAEDTIYLAEYLNNFEESIIENEDGSITKRKFNLEKVGQYLENRNLHQVPKVDVHHLWNKLLEENECLRNSKLLLPHNKQTSLIQERDRLFKAIDDIFTKPDESISESFELDASVICYQVAKPQEQFVLCSHYSSDTNNKHRDLLITTLHSQECLVLEFDNKFQEMKTTRIQLLPGPLTKKVDIDSIYTNLKFVDLKFYNDETVSMLLKNAIASNANSTHFAQFSLELAQQKSIMHAMPQTVNLTDMGVSHYFLDTFDHFNCKNLIGEHTNLAVSGSRKVASIVSEKGTKITIFEMEVEDEEDDTEMSQNSCLEISKESVE